MFHSIISLEDVFYEPVGYCNETKYKNENGTVIEMRKINGKYQECGIFSTNPNTFLKKLKNK